MIQQDPLGSLDRSLVLSSDQDSELEAHRRRQKLLLLLRGRFHWAALLALVGATVGATIGYFSQPHLYAGNGQIEMLPAKDRLLYKTHHNRGMRGFGEFVHTQILSMQSPRVLAHAEADEAWRNAAAKARVSDRIDSSSLFIDTVKKTYQVNVKYLTRDPDLALAGVRAVINAYMRDYQNRQEQSESQNLKFLYDRRNSLQSELDDLKAQKDELSRTAIGSNSLKHRYGIKIKNIEDIESELQDLEIRMKVLQVYASDLKQDMLLSELQIVERYPQMHELLKRRQEFEDAIKVLQGMGFMDNHNEFIKLQVQLDALNSQISRFVRQVREWNSDGEGIGDPETLAEINQLRVRQAELGKHLDDEKRTAEDWDRKITQFDELDAAINTNTVWLHETKQEIERRTVESQLPDNVQVVNTGQRSNEPANGKGRIKRAVLGGGGGASLGIGILLMIGILDRRLRHVEEAETDAPSARLLGVLPTLPANLDDPDQAVLMAHSVHHIRTLLQIGRDPTGLVYSITSPAAGSGKTSLTVALGLSFSASESRTLLIDCDIVGGGLTQRMGVVVHRRICQVLLRDGIVSESQISHALSMSRASGIRVGEALVELGHCTREDVNESLVKQSRTSMGLLDACGDERVEECIVPTGLKNLFVLPIGTALPQHAGTLSPVALRRVISEARGQFDTVIVDTGPLLGSLEASMVAFQVDGTVLIVSRGDPKPMVGKCIRHLKSIEANLSGIVFNNALNADIIRSNYGSVMASQSRQVSHRTNIGDVNAQRYTRLGPLATAVATYTSQSEEPMDNNGKA